MVQYSSIIDLPRDASKGNEDSFSIKPFEDGLTEFIKNANTPLTIALQGEWGSGKTSLMNSLNNNLCKDNGEFHAIWINTWEYSLMQDAPSTLMSIIKSLVDEISGGKEKGLLEKVAILGKGALTFAAGMTGGTLSATAVGAAVGIQETGSKSTISEIRKDLQEIIQKSLAKSNKKGFIFFIDDLDRMNPPTAVQLLELLKNIFTLERCVFILAIDYDVVVKGLEPKFGKISEQNEREFRSFFDKIIQVPFSMPVAKYVIGEFLKNSLLAIHYFNEKQTENEELITRISDISNLSVGTNPRALKRLLNSLSLIKCINAGKNIETELTSLVNFALVSLQVAYPSIYQLLEKYPDFDQWDEDVAIEENLQPLSEQTMIKLDNSDEFNEDWEKVLFRFCEKEHYLKKRAFAISRLLNKLKGFIEEKEGNIEDVVRNTISLSSVTNVDADNFSGKSANSKNSDILRAFRNALIELLRASNKKAAKLIQPQGRVQTKACIKFSKKDGEDYVRLSFLQPSGDECKLILYVEKRFAAELSCMLTTIESGLQEMTKNSYFQDMSVSDFESGTDKKTDKYVVRAAIDITLPTREDFLQAGNMQQIALVIERVRAILKFSQ
jgi:predicted KAP-like P-loop ATPase